MKWFFLVLVLSLGGGFYLRSQQPAFWNEWIDALEISESPHDDTTASQTADSAAPSPPTAVPNATPAPVISATLSTAPLVVTSNAEADFLTQLNAESAEIDQKVNAMLARNGNAEKKAWNALDAQIDDYQRKMASSPLTVNNAQIRKNLLTQRENQIIVATNTPCDFGRYRTLVREFLTSPFPEVAALGRQKAQPIDIQYTAVDGTPVDLAQLRGKVVLVDFWAWWCVYCQNEAPSIVAAYAKYHGRGLEIIGVSLDDDHTKAMMLNYISSNGMSWPQYFGGDHLGNFITKKYNVSALPALWLVDKHGHLINATRGADLPDQVEKALAEK